MALYTKRTVVEAIQLPPRGVDMDEDAKAALRHVLRNADWESGRDESLIIYADDGDMQADPYDWIVRENDGKDYDVLPDTLFRRFYAPLIKESK